MILFGPVNQAVFDWPWSFIHLLSGLTIGVLFVRSRRRLITLFIIGVGLLVLWEFFEGFLRWLDANHHGLVSDIENSLNGAFFDRESLWNIVGDMIIGSLGIFAVLRVGKKRTG